MNDIFIDHEALRNAVIKIQTGFGVPETDAKTVADCLVESNLMGIDTHGVIRLKPYMERIKAGGNNPHPNIEVIRDNVCSAVIDADNALGPVGGKYAMDLAISKADFVGMSIVIIKNCNHYGPAGYYARMALQHDMIGISMTNVLASMPPTGGAQAHIGNNAYSIAFPAKDEPPVVVDGATSMSSWGKLYLCKQEGVNLPEDCYVDSEGNPTVNPDDVINGGSLLPFAGHKGYGIAVAIELLTGMLGNTLLGYDIPHPYKHLDKPGGNTFFMAAIRLSDFVDPNTFKNRLDEWVKSVHNIRRAKDIDRIWLPGEKEYSIRSQRISNGIPLSQNMIQELESLASEVDINLKL